jgi:hypothetical protein
MKLDHKLKRKIEAIEHRIARLESILQFLREHPAIGTRSNLKPLSTGLMGLVIDGKAFIRPEGVRKEALRLRFGPRILLSTMRTIQIAECTMT